MKKLFSLIITSFLLISIFTACSNNNTPAGTDTGPQFTEGTEETASYDSEKEQVTEISTVQNDLSINVLTGETLNNISAYGKRPIAVMVNNVLASLPQYGTEQADLIYELPVEGGITRLMAVYADYTNLPDICSIRSCRYYYPIIANGIDAVYAHWGSDKSIALDTLNRLGIDHVDGEYISSPVFGRDKNRKGYKTEHTGYLSGAGLKRYLEENGFRMDRNTSETIFAFSDLDVRLSEIIANNVNLPFSNSYFSTFTYNAEKNLYYKQHSGKDHIDSSTGNQLSFKNIIVLSTEIKKMSPESPLMNINLDFGEGYYISGGYAEKINWSRKDDNSPINLTKKDGTELKINKGKSYIGIIGKEKNITIN